MRSGRQGHLWRVLLLGAVAVVAAGCAAGPPWTAALQATAPKGSVMLFNRTSASGYTVAGADLCLGFSDLFTAQVSRPHRYLKLYPTFRTGKTPRGTLEMLSYIPYDGAIVAYVLPSVVRVQWMTPAGSLADTMVPVDGWAVLVGPRWPKSLPVKLGPPEGRLLALDSAGRTVASLVVSTASAVRPGIGGSGPANPLSPACPS